VLAREITTAPRCTRARAGVTEPHLAALVLAWEITNAPRFARACRGANRTSLRSCSPGDHCTRVLRVLI
jgi:hypothetical protein